MIKIEYKNKKFKVSGTWNMGYAGIFNSSQISVGFDFDEICDALEYSDSMYKELFDKLNEVIVDEEEFAKALTDFYNELEKKVIDNHSKINNQLLLYAVNDMFQAGTEFWNNPITLKEEYKNETFNYDNVYAPSYKKLTELMFDKNIQDKEQEIRNLLPMFDFNKLISGIKPEYLCLNLNSIAYQCSDSWEKIILCGAYDELDENFEGQDWHNF